MKVKEIFKILKADGWFEVKSRSSHRYFKHEEKKGKVTVPFHGRNRKLPTRVLKSILNQADLD